jgi:hypothetical protein
VIELFCQVVGSGVNATKVAVKVFFGLLFVGQDGILGDHEFTNLFVGLVFVVVFEFVEAVG